MRTIILSLLMAFGAMSIQAQAPNTLSKKEKNEGWILLFNGKDFNGWRQCNGTTMPPEGFWVIENGAMRIVSRAEKPQIPRESGVRVNTSGDILYHLKKFKNFELSIDWNIPKGGNSGIFYYVTEVPGQPIYIAAPEIQILDNWNAGDNKLTNHLAGSLYDMLPALPSNAKPHGEWNTIVIRVKDGRVTHTQNGVKVCEYTIWTPEWYQLVANSKFKDWEWFKEGKGPANEGYIGLQDHNDFGCSFRNIKIREL
jgi:hypothetical protein